MWTIRSRLLLLGALLFSGAPLVHAQNLFDEILSPLRGVSIAQLYLDYSSLIDFALFLILFLGIAQIVFMRRFEGRGAKALIVAVGIILALSLAVAEETVGFSLVHIFGPIASTVFVVLVGIVMFFLLTGFGIGKVAAASLTYIVLYLSFKGLAPSFFAWVAGAVPVLGGLLALGLLAAVVLLVKAMVSHFHGAAKEKFSPRRIRELGRTIRSAGPGNEEPRIEERIQKVEKEKKLEHTARKQSKRLVRDSKRIIDELKELRGKLKGPGPQNENIATEVTKTLSELRLDDQDLTSTLRSLSEKHDRLQRCDIESFHELQKEYEGTALDRAKILLRDEIEQEVKRLRVEKRLSEFEREVGSLVRYFESYLGLAVNHMKTSEYGVAVTLIDKAVAVAQRFEEILKEMRHLDRLLEKLMKRELKTLKKQEKTVRHRQAA